MVLSNQEKKDRLSQWKTQQARKYLLNRTKVRQLFRFLEKELSVDPCDNSLRRTKLWVTQHCPPEQIDATLQEIQEMGGYCDCEVLLNC